MFEVGVRYGFGPQIGPIGMTVGSVGHSHKKSSLDSGVGALVEELAQEGDVSWAGVSSHTSRCMLSDEQILVAVA